MNILYVVNSSLANSGGGGRTRVIDAARYSKRPHNNILIACFVPFYLFFTKPVFIRKGLQNLQQELGCRVFYCPRLFTHNIPLVVWLNSWYCGLTIACLSWLLKIDLVHAHGAAPGIYCLNAQRIHTKLRVVSDMHGVVSEEHYYARGLSHKDRFTLIYEAYDQRILASADWLIFVSKAMHQYYVDKFQFQMPNYSIIPCATRASYQYDLTERSRLREQFGITEKLVFCYVGSAAPYQLISEMCALFMQVHEEDKNTFFLVISHHQDEFRGAIRQYNIDPESYQVMTVEHEKLFNLLQIGDIGLLLRSNSLVNRVASPTKFAEYCLCGLPVITTEYVGDISRLVNEFHIGCTIGIHNQDFGENFQNFLADVRQNRDDYAQRCSAFVKEHFSWEMYGELLANIYGQLT